MTNKIFKQMGVSLLELMITLAISTGFVLASASIMTQNNNSFRPAQSMLREQDGVVSVFALLFDDIKTAGFYGPNSASKDQIDALNNNIKGIKEDLDQGVPLADITIPFDDLRRTMNHVDTTLSPAGDEGSLFGRPFNHNIDTNGDGSLSGPEIGTDFNAFFLQLRPPVPIEGFDGNNASVVWLPSGMTQMDDGTPIEDASVENSDGITIRGAYPLRSGSELAVTPGPGATNIELVKEIPKTGAYILTNANESEIFYADANGKVLTPNRKYNVDNVSATFVNVISHKYSTDPISANTIQKSFVLPVNYTRYYVGAYDEGNFTSALYREAINPSAEGTAEDPLVVRDVLFPGVVNMQITYGVDKILPTDLADGIPNQYVPANLVPDWNDVLSVRVALVVQSEMELAFEKNTTWSSFVNGQMITLTGLNDRYVRRVYTRTFTLGNVI